MTCLAPILFILNTNASIIETLPPYSYKLPDPHVTRALDLCYRKLGTCPKTVSIFPSDHIHVTCKRKTK